MSDDRELVTAYQRTKSETAFRALYRKHTPYLYGMAFRLAAGHDDAVNDLVQDTWVRAAQRLDRFRWKSELRTWLAGIMVNCHREATRREAKGGAQFGDMDQLPVPPDHIHARLDLEQALAKLPRGYREIVVLYHIYGFTHRQIADLMRIDEGTSKSQLARGRKRLATLLA